MILPKEDMLRNMDKVIENCGGIDYITYNIEDNYYGFSLWLNNGDVVIYGTPDKDGFKDNMKIIKKEVDNG